MRLTKGLDLPSFADLPSLMILLTSLPASLTPIWHFQNIIQIKFLSIFCIGTLAFTNTMYYDVCFCLSLSWIHFQFYLLPSHEQLAHYRVLYSICPTKCSFCIQRLESKEYRIQRYTYTCHATEIWRYWVVYALDGGDSVADILTLWLRLADKSAHRTCVLATDGWQFGPHELIIHARHEWLIKCSRDYQPWKVEK